MEQYPVPHLGVFGSRPLVACTFLPAAVIAYRYTQLIAISRKISQLDSQILLLSGDGERLTDGHDIPPWRTKCTSRIARARRRSSTREVRCAPNWRLEASMNPPCRWIDRMLTEPATERNPKAFAVARPGKLQRQAARSSDVRLASLHSLLIASLLFNILTIAFPFRSRKSVSMFLSSTDFQMRRRRASSPLSALPALARRLC